MAEKLTPKDMARKKTDFDKPIDPGQTSLFGKQTTKKTKKPDEVSSDQKGKKKSLADQIEEREKKTPQKKKSLREQIEEREERAAETAPARKPIVTQIAGDERNDKRSKTLSLRVYTDIHDAFTKINRRRGMSTNSVLNMLITQYIRDNRDILDET